jgi:hypothetical protein
MTERSAPEHLRILFESQEAREQLARLGNFWIGPDIEITKPTVVRPDEILLNQSITLTSKDLPSGVSITQGAIGSLNVSVRSFFAQSGIDIRFGGANIPEEALDNLRNNQPSLIPVDIKNYGDRAVQLEGRVMRFFWANDVNRLRGANLKDVINTNEFSVEGEEGIDWFLGGYDENEQILTTGENSDQGLCVVVKLTPNKFYTPFAAEPIARDERIPIREQLGKYLVPLPVGMERNFEVGETPKITVGKDILAVINTGIDHQGRRHISSPLIDPGSDWKIRTEIMEGQKEIELFLYKK